MAAYVAGLSCNFSPNAPVPLECVHERRQPAPLSTNASCSVLWSMSEESLRSGCSFPIASLTSVHLHRCAICSVQSGQAKHGMVSTVRYRERGLSAERMLPLLVCFRATGILGIRGISRCSPLMVSTSRTAFRLRSARECGFGFVSDKLII